MHEPGLQPCVSVELGILRNRNHFTEYTGYSEENINSSFTAKSPVAITPLESAVHNETAWQAEVLAC